MSKETGVVKWFSRLKGYGYINPDDGGDAVFVHHSAIEGGGFRELYQGDRVAFELVKESKSRQAINVTRQDK